MAFWLKKMYLLRQIPFSDRLIQKGLRDVDVWLCSTGGAGSNLLKDHIDKYVKVKSPYLAALLTHHKEPVQVNQEDFKAVYLHSDPFQVLKSVKRRGLVKTNIKKLNNTRLLGESDELLLESVFRQFNNWTETKVNYPVLCIKYEALYDSLDLLGDFLSIPFDDFPPKRERLSHEIDIEEHLFQKFESQYQIWKEFPDSKLLGANEKPKE